jgi:hypothetical protein
MFLADHYFKRSLTKFRQDTLEPELRNWTQLIEPKLTSVIAANLHRIHKLYLQLDQCFNGFPGLGKIYRNGMFSRTLPS